MLEDPPREAEIPSAGVIYCVETTRNSHNPRENDALASGRLRQGYLGHERRHSCDHEEEKTESMGDVRG